MRKRLALVLGVFVTLLVSGCGQQATSSGSATKLTVEEGTFKFALSGMAKPYNYTDKDGKLAGFDVDVAMEVGKRLGLTLGFRFKRRGARSCKA